jgi:general secretion pathway protein M
VKSYLSNLNERERWMVISAAVCVFFYCYYLFLYAPLSTSVEQKSRQLEEKIQTLEWMKHVRNEIHTSSPKKNLDNNQLLTLLANQLKNKPTLKFPYHLQQTSSGDIQLTFDNVPFNEFMSWLTATNDQYTLLIKQFEASNTPTPGLTKLMIILSAS